MIIRPAGYSSSDDDFDGFGDFIMPSSKSNDNQTPFKYNLGETRQTVDKKISIMEQIKNCIQNGNVEEMVTILSSDVPGFDINGEFESTLWTPLLYAASLGNAEIVSELLINGADPNIHKDSYTPLMAVCSCELEKEENLVQCAHDLISFNAQVKVADRFGMTPLMFAALHGHEELVSLLIPLSDLEAVDVQKWTALFFAVSRGHKKVVEKLLFLDMDLSRKDIRGCTVKQLAIDKGYVDIAEIVTDPNALDLVTLEDIEINTTIPEWEDMFPGIKVTKKLPYFDDVKSFMYGINLPQFIDLMYNHKIGLPTLLTITDGQLECVGISLPFQRREILHGVHDFHGHRWNKKSLGEIPKELFSVYDVLHNFGISNKHVCVMKSSIEYLHIRLNYMKNLCNIRTIDDEKLENIQGLHNNKTAILKELNDLKYRIESTKCTLHKLRNRIIKIEKNVTEPPDYITATNFQITKFQFSKRIIFYSVITLSLMLVIKKHYYITKISKLSSIYPTLKTLNWPL